MFENLRAIIGMSLFIFLWLMCVIHVANKFRPRPSPPRPVPPQAVPRTAEEHEALFKAMNLQDELSYSQEMEE